MLLNKGKHLANEANTPRALWLSYLGVTPKRGANMIQKQQAAGDPGDGEFVLVRWLKADGETVFIGEPIAELETEQGTMDLPAWINGVLRHIARGGGSVDRSRSGNGFCQN